MGRKGKPKERWMDGERRGVSNHGLTEKDTVDRDIWRNLLFGEIKPTYSGQIHKGVNKLPLFLRFIIIIIIIIITSFMQGIHTYTPETNHVSRVYSVAAILRVLLMVHIALSAILNSSVLLH
jgi:hypothetical protein